MTHTITPLCLGCITRKKSNMLYSCGNDESAPFPLVAFLLVSDGHKILVDTGGSVPDGVKWMPYERKPSETLPTSLKSAGVDPDEIDTVIFTHLHWDHAGNSALLHNARFYVQRAEYMLVAAGEAPGYERDLILPYKYELLVGDTESILPGISVLLTPGHSVGSQCILVDTQEGKVVIAGDLLPTYENIRKKIPNGGNYDIDVICKSMTRVLSLGYPIIPGHEAAVFRQS